MKIMYAYAALFVSIYGAIVSWICLFTICFNENVTNKNIH